MGIIKINNIASTDVGLNVETPPNYDVPEKIYDRFTVPGRNGDILIDTGSYSNSTRSYDVSFGSEGGDFATLSNRVIEWLNNNSGYIRLEDSYTPDIFMMARWSGPTNIENILQQAGKFTLDFDRKPQRFLKIGESPITITQPTTVNNPTRENSKPLIVVYGTGAGTVTIGDYSIGISTLNEYVNIDSDTQNAYKNSINMNGFISVPNGFPMLKPGVNAISFSGAITRVVITPRWWRL